MFEVTARMKIRDGQLDGFKQHAAEIMRLTREQDTKTLRYDWFLSDDGTECEVRECYVDADGLLDHNTHVQETRNELFRDHAYGHEMTIYDEPSPALAELIERLEGHVAFNRYSFLRGLDGEIHACNPAAFEASARLRIREGQLEGFKHQAGEVIGQMSEQVERPLRYDWFLREDGTECEVREAYASANALLDHQRKVAEAKMKLFRDFIDGHTMTFYEEPSPGLAGALQAMSVAFRQFSFFQGLEADAKVLDGVPA